MGMFDSFVVPCLFCKAEVREQTKSGACMMDVYRFDDPDLPVWIMQEFDGVIIECYECKRRFCIVFDVQIIVKSKKLEPVDNLDMLELKVKEQEEGG
jgi:hypothetical protein